VSTLRGSYHLLVSTFWGSYQFNSLFKHFT